MTLLSGGPDLLIKTLLSGGPYLLIKGFVVFEQGLEGFENLHLTGDAGRRLGLSLHHRHPQTPLVAGHQALQVLQQQLGTQQASLQTENLLLQL